MRPFPGISPRLIGPMAERGTTIGAIKHTPSQNPNPRRFGLLVFRGCNMRISNDFPAKTCHHRIGKTKFAVLAMGALFLASAPVLSQAVEKLSEKEQKLVDAA